MTAFLIIAILTIVGAMCALTMRNLVRCALALTVSFAGLAALYLKLDAQFAGFAQVLVYIGAVAILLVFAILLTRGSEPPEEKAFSSTWLAGAAVAGAVFALLSGVVLSSRATAAPLPPPPQASVAALGDQLMTQYILPLEVLGLLLTAALLGAVIIAVKEGKST